MIDRSRWCWIMAHVAVLWEESGQNLAVFCYLIGWGTLILLRSQTLALIPIFVKQETDCSHRSSIFSANYTVRKDFEN
jgi:hypothetical protein